MASAADWLCPAGTNFIWQNDQRKHHLWPWYQCQGIAAWDFIQWCFIRTLIFFKTKISNTSCFDPKNWNTKCEILIHFIRMIWTMKLRKRQRKQMLLILSKNCRTSLTRDVAKRALSYPVAKNNESQLPVHLSVIPKYYCWMKLRVLSMLKVKR